jgi:hypothetical protein
MKTAMTRIAREAVKPASSSQGACVFALHAARTLLCALVAVSTAGCFAARGVTELSLKPFPVIYEDEEAVRFGEKDDSALIEVERARISAPLENLAIHYRAFFPNGATVRPGDKEEYVEVAGKNAYKVTFATDYVRRRARIAKPEQEKNPPEGWTVRRIEDPSTGNVIPVLYGPVIPRQRALYLIEGDKYLYYVFMRADGDAIEPTKKKFENLVENGIAYK